jgi:aminopeptidase N
VRRMKRRTLGAAGLAATVLMAGCTSEPARRPDGASSSAPAAAGPPSAPAVDYTPWAAGKSQPVPEPMYPGVGNAGLDVLHYGLELSWAPQTGILTGRATVQIRPTADASAIKLDFQPYALDSVAVDDKPVTGAAVAGHKLTVPSAVTADEPVTLTVAYHGKPATTPMPSERSDAEPLGLTVDKTGGLWTMQEPYGAFTWYPANDVPSDEALYDVAVTVPAGWSAIAAGTPAGQQGSTFTYRSADPMATYVQTLAVGKYTKVTAAGPHGLPLTYWYRPGVDDKLVPAIKRSPEYVSFLEQRFGPYPFPSGGILVVDSASGMETQQMITIGGKAAAKWSKDVEAGFTEDLLHEYAHQWYGDAVTPDRWDDLWLSEGWAMFAQYLWEQKVYKVDDKRLMTYLRQVDAEDRKKWGPPAHARAGQFAMPNVYRCPAAMLQTIRMQVGDTVFFAMARDWVQTQRNSTQTRASFTAFVNGHTHKDFTKLINTWLDSPTTPA